MTTIFTVPDINGTNWDDGFSYVSRVTITGGASDQIRVKLYAGPNNGGKNCPLDHVSIGIWNGNTTTDPCGCTAVPVELLFSGGHGVTIASTGNATSDWSNLTGFTSSDKLVLRLDLHNTGSSSGSIAQEGTFGAQSTGSIFSFATYNTQSPGVPDIENSTAGLLFSCLLIEVQAAAGGDTLQGSQQIIFI